MPVDPDRGETIKSGNFMEIIMDRLERPDTAAVPVGSDTPQAGWKRALRGVAAAALRLHYYRFVRTRMLHDALSARDANDSGDCRQ